MTIIKIKTKRWKDDKITKCSSEQNLWREKNVHEELK